jgi:hypothetical protein
MTENGLIESASKFGRLTLEAKRLSAKMEEYIPGLWGTETREPITEELIREIVRDELRDFKEDQIRSDPLFKKILAEIRGAKI